MEEAIGKHDLVAASVLSGNRNFEARVHQSIKANFLMSPPLVVAFALAGRVDIDLSHDPIGRAKTGGKFTLRDIWPTLQEVRDQMKDPCEPEVFRQLYRDFAGQNPKWNEIPAGDRQGLPMGRQQAPISRSRRSSSASVFEPGEIREIKGARPRAFLATASRPTTFRLPAASRRVRRRGNTCSNTERRSRISTATARGAAMTG